MLAPFNPARGRLALFRQTGAGECNGLGPLIPLAKVGFVSPKSSNRQNLQTAKSPNRIAIILV
jgi:hypothetical protein